MAQFAIDKTLTLDDLRFHYRDWNGYGWPILLMHGLSSTSHIWDLVAPLLSDAAQTVALDLRGHGRSDKPDCPYTFNEVGGDVVGVLDELHFEHPVLVGHSYGANVALWVAATHPERIGGLIMIDGGLTNMGAISWQDTLQRLTPPKLDGVPIDEFRERIIQNTPQGLISPAVEASILANFEIDAENRIHRRLPVEYHLRILRAMWEQRLTDLYDKVTCPTLILPTRRAGDEAHGLAEKEKGVAEAERLIEDVEVVWLEDTIHDAPVHRPHLVADEIKRFIKDRL